MKHSGLGRTLAALTAVLVIAAACSSGATTAPPASPTPTAMAGGTSTPAASSPAAGKSYTIGYSNGGRVGNGFREEQVCTAKAEAKALGTDKISQHHGHPSQH